MTEENKSVKNFPNLRFPGFEDSWEERKLGEIGELTSSKRIYLSDYVDDGIPFYRGKEISELKQKIQPKDILYISSQLYNEYKIRYGVPEINDILITAVGTLGNILVIKNKEPFYFKDGNLIWFKNIIFDSNFVAYLLEINKKGIELSAIGSSQKALTMVELKKLSFQFPSIAEQNKIASFLLLVDERIQTQKKIIEDICKMKLKLSHNLFTQNFRINRQYISKWKEKTLGDISAILMGQSPDSSAYNIDEKGLPLIQGNADIIQRFSQPRQFTSQITKTCDIGDIILTVRAPVGYVAKSKHFACIGRGVCAIKSNEKSDSEFIYQFLLYFENKWSSFEQGSTFTSVNSSDIKTIKINVPTIEEQREIAQFLKIFDEKINIETELLLQYENQKKYLLQNLFV
ncbi:restriction endonuclease subunit S [Elizabethkingia anophelis]|nr:restriction endonuclease subunit S [Elizabethkingia anophelis]